MQTLFNSTPISYNDSTPTVEGLIFAQAGLQHFGAVLFQAHDRRGVVNIDWCLAR